MEIKEILKDIVKIEALVERWQTEPISNIEREIVLEKLRKVYDKIIFIDSVVEPIEQTEQTAQTEPTTEAEQPTPATEPAEAEPQAYQTFAAQEQVSYEFNEDKDEDELMDELADDAPLTFNVPSFQEPETENKEYIEIEEEDVPDLAAQSAVLQAPDTDFKEMFNQSKVDTQTINSLYGEPTPAPASQSQTAPTYQSTPAYQTATEPAQQTAAPVAPAQPQTTVQPAEHPATEHVADTFTVQAAPHKPIVSKTIRAGIGMNDKYIMTRNMFNSDSRLFEQTINQLDEMTDINDALIYINDNFNWNPDDNSVKLLIKLLENKLL